MTRVRSCYGLILLLGVGALAGPAYAYEGSLHQRFTFLAAKQFNQCIARSGAIFSPLTPLQVRYIAKANVRQAQTNIFTRLFRWNYYDRAQQSPRSLLWLIDTRFHKHFNEVVGRLSRANEPDERFKELGRLASYVQDVSSPAHAVPVYTARFWRFSLTDRFDSYPVDDAAVAAAVEDVCADILQPAASYDDIVQSVAANTIDGVESPLFGMPATWQAFWRLGDTPDVFGEYGRAGNNFGRKTEFRCAEKQRCVLLNDDPLYREFALKRHVTAVIGTMRAMALLQYQNDDNQLSMADVVQ